MRKALLDKLEMEFRGGLREDITPHAGVSLLIETGRVSGIMETAERCLPAKKSARGLGQGQLVEAFVVMSALGGECLDDFDPLRKDRGLAALLGYSLPAASTARQWLDQFHEEELVAGRPQQGSFIPQESARLTGLGSVLDRTIHAYVASVSPEQTVTLDVDAHLVESTKETALYTYEGFRGYQPLLVTWAESGLIMAEEFRDGNVPASQHIRELVDTAYGRLPYRPDGWQIQVRSDGAAYEHKVLDHWHAQGWRFAVSAAMHAPLRQEIAELPETAWHLWSVGTDDVVREWAEVPYVPSRTSEHRDTQPFRYVAIRVRTIQGRLFADGNAVKHFAIVSNDWETDGQELLEWQRGKAGTVEHVHRVLKDELGAGVYPSAKFGANAAWLRLQVLTHNLLEILKAVALDPPFRHARPKRLRFAVFTQIGWMVRHARQQFMRVVTAGLDALLRPARRRLACAVWS